MFSALLPDAMSKSWGKQTDQKTLSGKAGRWDVLGNKDLEQIPGNLGRNVYAQGCAHAQEFCQLLTFFFFFQYLDYVIPPLPGLYGFC